MLTDFEEVYDPLDWEVGKHGIEVEFKADPRAKKTYRGTFLPNVASDNGWNQW